MTELRTPYKCPTCQRSYRTPEHAAGCADDHGPRTWPASAAPAAIAADIAATPRAMPEYPPTPMPPLVFPRPQTDPALVGTEHDTRARGAL